MKLATYQDGSRDGQLVVVSRDLTTAHFATGIATRLQTVLDDWNFLSPQLEDLYATLNGGKARHAFAFDPRLAMAPLPRAALWLTAADVQTHAESPPTLHLRAADRLGGPHDDAVFAREAEGIDLGAGLAVVAADLPLGCSPARALDGVRLLLLVNGWALRGAGADGALQPRPATAPVAVTPDELGGHWRGGRAALRVKVDVDGKPLGRFDARPAQRWSFGELLSQAAAVRALGAGSVVGAGTWRPVDAAQGTASRADLRRREQADHGTPRSPWLADGAQVQIEALDGDGQSVFGRLLQRVRHDRAADVTPPPPPTASNDAADPAEAPA